MRPRRWIVTQLLSGLVLAGCAAGPDASGTGPVSLEIVDVFGLDGDTVAGNVVALDVVAEGIDVAPPDGDTSETTGHFHVFVDRDPVPVGEAIPAEDGIVHAADTPIEVFGLATGQHRLVVVLGDGTHTRIHDDAVAELAFTVAGPVVQVSGPSSVAPDEPVVLDVTVEGVELVPADGDTSGASGHLHVFVDRAPQDIGLGETIPAEEGIVHTTDTRIELTDLGPGEHVIYVVLGDGTHTTSWPAPVADRLVLTVG